MIIEQSSVGPVGPKRTFDNNKRQHDNQHMTRTDIPFSVDDDTHIKIPIIRGMAFRKTILQTRILQQNSEGPLFSS
jgi:hypothetical protein